MTAIDLIGRLGALALALGIGATVPGVAHAAPEDSSSSAGSESSRRPARADRPALRPAQSARTTAGDHRAKRKADAATPPKPRLRNDAVAPAPAAARSSEPLPGPVVEAVSARPAVAVTAAKNSVAQSVSTSPAIATAVRRTAVMAAPRPAAATVVQSVLSSWLQTGSGSSVESPLSWAVFAAVRRERGWSAGRVALPAVVVAANKPPVISLVKVGSPNVGTGVVTGTVKASDPEGAKLAYKATTTSKGTVSITAAGVFTYTPTSAARHAAAKVGATTSAKTDTVTVTVTDARGAVTSKGVTVTISPRNAVPVAGTPRVGTPNSTTGVVTGTVGATDADRDTLTYTAPALTGKGTVAVTAGTGAFTYTPTAAARGAATGTDTFTVTVTDGYGGSTPIVVSVPVAAAVATPAKISFVFNYGAGSSYWTAEAKSALQAAADGLAAYLVVTKPVTLVFDVTAEKSPGSATLASTGSDLIPAWNGFVNTVVQNKILKGVDSNGAEADGSIDVNFGNPWAYGNSVGVNQYDFKSTMMHELLHAYGFLAYVDRAGTNTGTTWTVFDSFIGTISGTKVVSPNTFRFNTAFNTNLTGGGGGLFFLGPKAVAAYGGPVPLYTPWPWEPGSSVSHLDDDTFAGARSKLMNAYSDTGLGTRTLSAIELGILQDIGYTVTSPSGSGLLLFGVIVLRRRKRSGTAAG